MHAERAITSKEMDLHLRQQLRTNNNTTEYSVRTSSNNGARVYAWTHSPTKTQPSNWPPRRHSPAWPRDLGFIASASTVVIGYFPRRRSDRTDGTVIDTVLAGLTLWRC